MDQGIMQPVGVKVTIRGRGELLLEEENVGIAGQGILRPGAPLQRPETPGKVQQVLWREVLVAYDDDRIRIIRVLNGPERRLVHVCREIHTDNFGPEGSTAWMHGQTRG